MDRCGSGWRFNSPASGGILLYGSLIRMVLRFRLRPALTWTAIVLGVVVLTARSRPGRVLGVSICLPGQAAAPARLVPAGLITALPVVLGFTFLFQARLHRRQQAREAGEAPPTSFGLLGAQPSRCFACRWRTTMAGPYRGRLALVLATLNQAMTALGTADGLQVHRSCGSRGRRWCAPFPRAAICDCNSSTGLRLPSPFAVAMVREAGWLTSEKPSGGLQRDRNSVDMTERGSALVGDNPGFEGCCARAASGNAAAAPTIASLRRPAGALHLAFRSHLKCLAGKVFRMRLRVGFEMNYDFPQRRR